MFTHVGAIVEEFAGADLGDKRRAGRLEQIAELLDKQPAAGFPRAMGSDAALEGFYRFINNDGFSAEDIVEPHIAATIQRAARSKTVLAVHDTTAVEFSTMREGLGITSSSRHQGFLTHAALLVAAERGLPLGLGYLETRVRTGEKRSRQRRKAGQLRYATRNDETRESLRWLRGIDAVEKSRRREGFEVIHVTDAEGDFFELLDLLRTSEARFVIRAGHLVRAVLDDGDESSVREVADKVLPQAWREIDISVRNLPARTVGANSRRRHPERSARRTRVAIGSGRVTLKKTKYSGLNATPLEVNIVRVWEPDPVTGHPPVEWILLTTEDVSTPASVERIVDIYRQRWIIEEYFKALKTGCSLEKRQVESYDALRKVLALFAPIAYRLLLLRGIERIDPTTPASQVFSPIELRIMVRAPSNRGLPPPDTVAAGLLHLAKLGGHIRNNGRPGWQTLAWGYEKLLTLRLGWELAEAQKCDQS
jgi:hypothetical protein